MNIKSRVISFVAVGLALCSVSGPHRAAGQSGAPTPTPEDRLYRAALNRQTAEVRALLKSGVDPNALNSFKTPPLLGALLLPSDTVETVRVLLEGGARTDVRDAQGRTPLILAAARGSLDVLRALLQARADVNARSQSGETALLAALQREAAEAALLLVQHGADPNLRGEQQPAALSLALQLWDTPRGVQHADRATVEAHVKNADALIAALLQARADVNAPAPSGRTPLMDAISRDRVFQPGGWRSWVRPLLDRGADPNAHLPKQEPPLFHTIDADRENLELPRLLIERGADVNGVENRSVLVEALRGHDFALAGLLLEKGAKIGVLDEARKTPLHWAAFHGQGELVRELLARGGDPNALDMLGQTPLALARKASHAEVAALLVRSGGRVAAPAQVPRNARGQVMVRLPLRLRAGGAGNGPVSYGVAEQGGVPALAVRSGGKAMAEPVRLGTLLTHPALWTPEERNNIRYQIGRGFYSPHAYQLFGLVASRGQTYVGIRWFAPAASNPQPLVGYVVARIRMRGRSLELTVVRAGGAAEVGGLNMVVGLTRYSPVPALTRSAAGNLVVTDARGRFRYVPPAEWVKVGPPPAEAR